MGSISSPNHARNLPAEYTSFYRRTICVLQEAGIPFLVGGAYAFGRYTSIKRHTKDLDLLLRSKDVQEALRVLAEAGFETEVASAHWLAKAFNDDAFIDLIFRSGNGLADVDDAWFQGAPQHEVLGLEVLLCPPEELLWTKAFIMERERYDGADVAHLLRSCRRSLDWDRLLELFGPYWRVLLSHLVLFGFIYPSERGAIPETVMEELLRRLEREHEQPAPSERICRGTLLSRAQYLVDVEEWGYKDARLRPRGDLSAEEIRRWTADINQEDTPSPSRKRESMGT